LARRFAARQTIVAQLSHNSGIESLSTFVHPKTGCGFSDAILQYVFALTDFPQIPQKYLVGNFLLPIMVI